MNNRITELLRGVSVLVSDISAACLLLVLIPLEFQWDFSVAIPLWLGVVCLQFLIGYAMLSAGTAVNRYLVFHGAAIVGSCVLVLRYSYCNPGWDSMRWFLGMFVLAAGVHSAVASWRLPESNHILRYVDAQIILLAFYLYTEFRSGHQGSAEYTVLPLAAMFLDLLTVNRLRTGGEQENVIHGAGTGGKLLLAVIGAGCLVLTAVIVGRGAEEIHTAVDVLVVFLGYLWSVVNLFFYIVAVILAGIILIFAWLLPSTPQAARENMQEMVQENVEVVAELAEEAIPLWVFELLGILPLLGIAGWILYRYRGKTLKRIKRISRRRNVVRKSRLFAALKEVLRNLRERLVFEVNYRRYRKTPQGLFVLAERTGKRCKLPRKKQESPGEYLRRLESELGMGEAKSLCQLAGLLDRIWYAGQDCALEPEEYKRYVKVIQNIGEQEKM